MRVTVRILRSVGTDLNAHKERLANASPSIDQSYLVDDAFRNLKKLLAKSAGRLKAAVEIVPGTYELEYLRGSTWVRYQVTRSRTQTEIMILSWKTRDNRVGP